MKAAILLIGLFLSLCIQLTAQTDQAKINEAMDLFKQKKFEEARVQILRSEGKSERKNSASFATMAWFINEARKYGFVYDEASYGKDSWLPDVLYKAEKALKYDKDNALGHLMRGASLYEKSDFANATKEYDIVEKMDPANCYLTLYRGNIDGATGQYEPAVTKYQKFIACNPDYPFVYWYLAKAYIGQHKFDDALAACKKYVSLAKSRGAKDSLVRCYYTMAAQSPANLKYLDSAYACINTAIFGEYGYSGFDVKEYYNRYKYLAQVSYNYSNKPTLDLVNACIENNIEAALAAVKNGANPNCLFDNRRYYRFKTYPILFAARVQSLTLMKALLEAGANPDVTDDIGYTALHYVSGDDFKNNNDRESLANLLVRYKANVNIQDLDGKTPLVFSRDIKLIRFLIANHADVSIKDNGSSPITHLYTGYDNSAGIVKLYIDHGADVNEVHPNGRNIFDDVMYYTPSSYATLYLLEKAKVRHTKRYNDASYVGAKEFIEYLQANVIGKPGASLFEALIASDLKKFRAMLIDVKDKKLLNYLSIATVNFTYGKPFYNALVLAGAEVAFEQYSVANKGLISGRSVFYARKTAPGSLADVDFHYGERMEELMADVDYYGNLMNSKAFVRFENCDNIIQFARVVVKMINLFKEVQANPAISAESKKMMAQLEKEERDIFNRCATRYKEESECGGVFPTVN